VNTPRLSDQDAPQLVLSAQLRGIALGAQAGAISDRVFLPVIAARRGRSVVASDNHHCQKLKFELNWESQ